MKIYIYSYKNVECGRLVHSSQMRNVENIYILFFHIKFLHSIFTSHILHFNIWPQKVIKQKQHSRSVARGSRGILLWLPAVTGSKGLPLKGYVFRMWNLEEYTYSHIITQIQNWERFIFIHKCRMWKNIYIYISPHSAFHISFS